MNSPDWTGTANFVLYDPRLRRYVAFGRFNGTSPKYFGIGRGVAPGGAG
jgi:hypothetical protein